MKLLHALESLEKGTLAQALEPLRKFIFSVESLLASEYGQLVSRADTSLRDLWLPILLLGNEWSKCAESLIGIPISSWGQVDCVSSIILTPVTQREYPSLRIRLHNEIEGIKRDDYKVFENTIKIPFALRTTYKTSDARIGFIDQKSRVIDAGSEDAEQMLHGSLPTWLSLLLKWDAVDQIALNYKYEPGEDICKYITSIVAVPACPGSVRSSAKEAEKFLNNCFSSLGVADLRASIPSSVLVIQTNTGEEWYQLLEILVDRIAEFLEKECGFLLDEQSHISTENDSMTYQEVVKRRIIFPANSDLRPGEFGRLSQFFEFSNDEEKGRVKDSFAWLQDSDLPELLKQRIGSINYLLCVSESLKDRCQRLINPEGVNDLVDGLNKSENQKELEENQEVLTAKKEPWSLNKQKPRDILDILSDKLFDLLGQDSLDVLETDIEKIPPYGANLDQRTASKTSDSLSMMTMLASFVFRAMLEVFYRNLDLGQSVIQLFSEHGIYSPNETGFHSISDGGDDDGIFGALAFLLRIAVHNEDYEARKTALAGALYVFDVNGVLPEKGPDGICDDEYCLASTILALEEHGLNAPESMGNWAFDYNANVDNLLSSEKQKKIHSVLEKYLLFLNTKE
ncbi:hypothetical protein [Thiocapsa imhoffii]|uniref:hypothetical protein n=1 Tax=Thiocapsa imhoffii TaxID=382777 RepID=UPI001904AD3B|nr:hypothetical protein [Thiocapsa imhoffii]